MPAVTVDVPASRCLTGPKVNTFTLVTLVMAVCPPCLLSIWVQTLSGPFSSLNLAPVAGYLVKVATSQNVETSTLAPLRCPLAHRAFYREPLPPQPVPLLYKIIEGSHIRVTSSPKIRTGSSRNVS